MLSNQNPTRVGTHLILYGSRVVVSKQSLSYASPTSRDNKDLKMEAQYYNLSGGRGTVSGVPNGSESITDIAWRLTQNSNPMAQNSAELVTWEFHARDGDTDYIPNVTVLHRMRGVVATLELPSRIRNTPESPSPNPDHAQWAGAYPPLPMATGFGQQHGANGSSQIIGMIP